MRGILGRLCVGVIGLATACAWGQGINYQGRLDWNGQPANGTFDFQFGLLTQPFGGTSIGNGVSLDDWPVEDGLVRALLNFGGAGLYGADRWIAVRVREGSSDGAYTELLPPQLVARTPRAFVADRLNFPSWAPLDPGLTFGLGNDSVFINRDTTITSSERFGVHSDQPGFQGMYVSTSLTNAAPFYGYSVAGGISAYHYYNNDAEDWRLFVKSDEILLASDLGFLFRRDTRVDGGLIVDGNAVVEDSLTAEAFVYENAEVRTVAVPSVAFQPNQNLPFTSGLGQGAASLDIDGLGRLVAPVYLPDNARITRMTAYVLDASPVTSISVDLSRIEHSGGSRGAAVLFTTGSGNSGFIQELSTAVDPPFRVDHSEGALRLSVLSQDWQGGSASSPLGIQSVVIEYTVAEPD